MNIDASSIDSPLALIALFVAIIELFLLYPIAKLEGKERTMLVSFVIVYPIFIAGAFFYFLWNKPINLYTPQTLSEDLQNALLPESLNVELAPDRAAINAIELKLADLSAKIARIDSRSKSSELTSLTKTNKEIATLDDLNALKDELLQQANKTGELSRESISKTAKVIQKNKIIDREQRVASAEKDLSKFRIWLQELGGENLPALPAIATYGVDAKGGVSIITTSEDDIEIGLGLPDVDYMIPGMYINVISIHRNISEGEAGGGMDSLVWYTAEYMANKFANSDASYIELLYDYLDTELKDQPKLLQYAKESTQILKNMYDTLDDTYGKAKVIDGVVAMTNSWSSETTLESSLKSLVDGMKIAEPTAVVEPALSATKRVVAWFNSSNNPLHQDKITR